MRAFVVSDIHLGSRFFQRELFRRFLAQIPEGVALVLNGDSTDWWRPDMPPEDEAVLQLLREESLRRTVIWVRGNHDELYELKDPGRIQFRHWFEAFGHDLLITHGHRFDRVMPRNRTFIRVFRFFHHLRMAWGAEPVHVAFYAKRYRWLYDFLCRHVAANAVRYARAHGYAAVACGHTHRAEDLTRQGVRYLNTGCWTERPVYYLDVEGPNMKLVQFESSGTPEPGGNVP
jgi:UDP-2,3-diacylglucosamine pyrophosphatase LpxH